MLLKETKITEIVDLQEPLRTTAITIEAIKTIEQERHLTALITEVVLMKGLTEVVPQELPDTHNPQREVVVTTRIGAIIAITGAQETPVEAIEVPAAAVMVGPPVVPLEVEVEVAVVAAVVAEEAAEAEEATKFQKKSV